MECERCQGVMFEEHVVVVGGVVSIERGVAAWHCRQCGRIEYRAIAVDPNILHSPA